VIKIVLVLPLMLLCASCVLLAHETVFNVASGDVLDQGKVYGELDFTYQHSQNLSGFAPRVVVGLGKRIEAGLNVNGVSTADEPQTTLSPTVKWKAYDGGQNGWAFLLGDDVFIPVQNRTYHAGNYFYAEFTKTWKAGTRVTFGGYHFTRDVIAAAQRAGGQFAIEQPLNKRVTLATDWYTGAHSLGFVTPGVILKVTAKLTLYGTYQIGNRGATNGNHQMLVEVGWNFN
jgi:hypothetical protein